MKNDDIQFRSAILRRDGYHAAARMIESIQGKISREAEMKYLKEFIRQSCFDEETSRDQLRCLWTAYCLHHGLDADTSGYEMTCSNCGTPRRKTSLKRWTGVILTALTISCANILYEKI